MGLVTSLMASMFVTLNTEFPCCGRKARIRATNDVPREVYDRTCKCGAKWEVERKTVRQGKDKRVDVLNWTRQEHGKTVFSSDGVVVQNPMKPRTLCRAGSMCVGCCDPNCHKHTTTCDDPKHCPIHREG